MRRIAKVDENQQAIVKALRTFGYSVLSLAPMGKGCPDLLVGKNGVNLLLEVKDGTKAPSKRRLTEDEVRFFGSWCGHRAIVESVEEALKACADALKPEAKAPRWTAEEWKRAGSVLRMDATRWATVAAATPKTATAVKAEASSASRVCDRMAGEAEAMARALEGA